MRVVFLTHNYPRHPGDVAGGFLHPLAVALHRRGVDVRVVAPSDRGRGGRDALDGIPISRVRYADAQDETLAYTGTMASATGSARGLKALAGLIRALRRGAREELDGTASDQGIVHAHWWMPAGLASPPEWPLVLTCHGSDARLLETGWLARMLARGPLHRARVVTTVSQELAHVLERRGRVAAIAGDSVQPMAVTDIDRPWSRGGGGIVVIGRLVEQKRVHLALRAYAIARQRGLTMPLTIAGDGLARAALRMLAGGLQLGDDVRFLGEVPPSEVPGLLGEADVALMPAVGEGFGLAAAEALMQGVPVVACRDGGGLLDVVPASGAGRVVAPTPEGIAQGLMELLADPGAKPAAQEAGAHWRERLSPDFVAERCLGWYRRALNVQA
ncbi:MAG: glycosyltransferase [Gemmatimonadota bacterium]